MIVIDRGIVFEHKLLLSLFDLSVFDSPAMRSSIWIINSTVLSDAFQ